VLSVKYCFIMYFIFHCTTSLPIDRACNDFDQLVSPYLSSGLIPLRFFPMAEMANGLVYGYLCVVTKYCKGLQKSVA
jgi:hypothetical protein